DLDDVDSKISTATRFLIVVHYFGFSQDLPTIRALCDRKGIAMIEDCAHAYFGKRDGWTVGSVGDFAIASPMKFFPVYDGGLLISAHRELDSVVLRSGGLGFELKAALSAIERAFGYARLKPFNWLAAPLILLKDSLW